jgi:mono/diheme cytochrome c family protein/uncharacterized protein YjiS (DUF1127 family)
MTDAAVHPNAPGSGAAWSRFTALLRRALSPTMTTHEPGQALDELPDNVLKDLGLARSDLPFVAGTLASVDPGTNLAPNLAPTRDALDHLSQGVAKRDTATRLSHVALRLLLVAVTAAAGLAIPSRSGLAQDAQIKRGRYLVTLGGCNDCHTPGYFFGKPDTARFLAGSEVGFEIPGLGVFHGPNLTPDRDTGLGTWSADEVVTAITAGRRPDGRMLAPVMPWHAFANLTGEDARAIAAFLKSLQPVKNKVPGPFGPGETPSSFVMKIVPPQAAKAGGPVPQ